MSFIDPQSKEIHCKIGYFGPLSSGKSTNLQQIYAKTAPEHRSQFITLNEKDEKTLFFDFLPLSLGEVKGYRIRLHLYTIPTEKPFEASRGLILKGIDGAVFVADSQVERVEGNLQSWKDFQASLKEQEVDLKHLPIIIQCNKRDLKNILPVEDLRHIFNGQELPVIEAVAIKGQGVMETLQMAAKAVLRSLK